MKKALSLTMALVLCLTLCACGVDERFKPLLEHLETQNYEGIKNELVLLSPDFKLEKEQAVANAEMLAKYQGLIDLLEAGNYEDALADVENRMPAPEYEVIDITMDNWNEYFEIVPDYYWRKNAFGEGEVLIIGFSLFLKDEYVARLPLTGNSKIACTVCFDAREKTLDVNWKETTFAEVSYTKIVAAYNSSGVDGGRHLAKPLEEACEITSELRANNMVQSSADLSNLFYFAVGNSDRYDVYNFYIGENYSMSRITGMLELLAQ